RNPTVVRRGDGPETPVPLEDAKVLHDWDRHRQGRSNRPAHDTALSCPQLFDTQECPVIRNARDIVGGEVAIEHAHNRTELALMREHARVVLLAGDAIKARSNGFR